MPIISKTIGEGGVSPISLTLSSRLKRIKNQPNKQTKKDLEEVVPQELHVLLAKEAVIICQDRGRL